VCPRAVGRKNLGQVLRRACMPAASGWQRLRATCPGAPLIPSYPPHGAPPVAPRMRPHLPGAVSISLGPPPPRGSHGHILSAPLLLCPSPPKLRIEQRRDRERTHARCRKLKLEAPVPDRWRLRLSSPAGSCWAAPCSRPSPGRRRGRRPSSSGPAPALQPRSKPYPTY
jgi:hypothetical protein